MTTEQEFLKDVENHVMQVIKDDGVYRHIRFRRPGTMCMYFDLITWPGYLCYCGDMGTYVFCRLEDMFEFFRIDREYAGNNRLFINKDYWAEKLQATDGGKSSTGATEYSPEIFEQHVKKLLVSWWQDYDLNRDERRKLREKIEDDVLAYSNDGAVDAYDAARLFSAKVGGQKFEIIDFWEVDCTRYTHHFIWCCYALAWGIQKYDQELQAVVPA
ncbi:hypothetical protein [Orrella sp. 11846]|uniref:hypothetical protein n=1 Tax=Orrella sp. 11846 TaxID=3409913 RepID=UPI003B5A7036